MSREVLTVTDLRAYYELPQGAVRAVDNVSLTVKKGEILALIGESACGKSTFVRSVLNLVKPPLQIKSGTVIYNGNVNLLSLDKKQMNELRWTKLAYVPQSAMNSLNPTLKIKEQLFEVVVAHENTPKKSIDIERVCNVLELTGLPNEVAEMYPHELSGGMKQRAIMSMAIMLNPDLLVVDEPTTALDVKIQRLILQILTSIKEKFDTSIVLVTHDIAVASEIADMMAVMYAGQIVEYGPIYSIFKTPFHPYTDALINSTPSIARKGRLLGLPGQPPNLLNPPEGCRFKPRCPRNKESCNKETLLHTLGERQVACHMFED